MKKSTKHILNFSLLVVALTSVVIFGCRCTSTKPDPLQGWKLDFNEQPNPTIVRDYTDYIQNLPSEERKFAVLGQFFEDGTGRHAIVIGIALNGTDWSHVLFYDKENKRINVIKHISGHYRS